VNSNFTSEIKQSLEDKFGDYFNLDKSSQIKESLKEDRTIVTEVDLFVSDLVKDIKSKYGYGDYTFFSEEDQTDLKYPAIILDPIDGTKELVKRIPECAVSLGVFKSPDFKNEGWIYNPFTKEEFISGELPKQEVQSRKLKGYVSCSEWKAGLFEGYDQGKIELKPVGSIAYKLALLARGDIDFVISLKPKSLWDIAAGTALCEEQGFSFYHQDELRTSFDKVLYKNPLCWCRNQSDYEMILSALK